MKIKELANKALSWSEAHSDDILTGMTCLFVVATGVSAFKAGPKYKRIMAEHKDLMAELDNKDLPDDEYKKKKRDICGGTVKELAPVIAPPVIFGSFACASAIGSRKVSSRKIAALSAAYEISKEALSNYKEAIMETVPKKADEIKEAVIRKKTQEEPIPTNEDLIYHTGRGDVLCKDIYTGVYFRSSMDEIEKAINRMSARVRDENWVTLQDLYYELGVKRIPPCSNDLGWHASDCIEGNLPIMVRAALDDTGTTPVLGLDYEVDPFFKEGGRFR